MEQVYIRRESYQEEIQALFERGKVYRVFLVCGHSALALEVFLFLKKYCDESGVQLTIFQDFESNPDYGSVRKGVSLFREHRYDLLIAVGGGSAIDVAKCIKTCCEVRDDGRVVTDQSSGIPFLAVPTTAGTGSEATGFAVIYKNGVKISAMCENMLPKYVLLDGKNLDTLPLKQRRAALADALCHAVESYWSVRSTGESKKYARRALKILLENAEAYFSGDERAQDSVLQAANLAGKAIQITQTTAAHAMCYKLTSMFHIPHGRAAFLCLPEVWEYMDEHKSQCVDGRGGSYLEAVFFEIACMFGCGNVRDGAARLKEMRKKWGLEMNVRPDFPMIESLAGSVNVERLANTPVRLNREDLTKIYRNIFR
ncbi:MAG: phosphonoacetaldehyde reductase [Roseburia sp.]|nr:phosphonoacetaldehyde reductase [Roseburia sp.]